MNVLFNLKGKEGIMLRADEQNYELCRPRLRKNDVTGEVSEEWTAFKWFASLDQALNRLVDMKIRASDARSLKALAADVAAARKEITDVWAAAVGREG